MSNVKPAARVEVTLAQKHTHKGRDFKRGDSLALRADQAEWLIAKGRAVSKGQPLPASASEIKTVKDLTEVEQAVVTDVKRRKAEADRA